MSPAPHQFFDGGRSHRYSSEDLRSVVVFGFEDAHETKSGGTVECARVEKHGWDDDPTFETSRQSSASRADRPLSCDWRIRDRRGGQTEFCSP